MTNTNFPNHWITAELVGAPPYLQRAAKDYAEAYALAALAQSGEGEAVTDADLEQLYYASTGQHLRPQDKGLAFKFGHSVAAFTRPQPAQPPEAQPAPVVDALRERLAQETGDDDDFASGLRSGLRIALDLLSTPTAAPTLSIKREEREALSKPATDLLTRSASGMGEYIREQGRLRAALPVVPLCTAPTPSQAAPCKGMNCGYLDGVNHSAECQAEHAATIAGGTFIKQQAAVTELEVQLAASLRKFVNSLSEQDDEGLIEHADSMIGARAALAAFEAKKEGA